MPYFFPTAVFYNRDWKKGVQSMVYHLIQRINIKVITASTNANPHLS